MTAQPIPGPANQRRAAAPRTSRLADAASGAGGPFAPRGVSFSPVSPSLATARVMAVLPLLLLLAAGLAIPAVLVSPWFWAGTGAAIVILAFLLWMIPRQVRSMGYALAGEHLLWRKGIMWRRMSVIPYGRMQYVDTSQGPIARRLGIAEVKLHTASAATDATINGLPVAEAEHLRQILAERGEERMAGL
ncbi:PH domain-containing protein [Actinomyces marmotae]|uniref:PH domain-containing protein n=1 Tax=Actinomyces marmotae TaxID=2737173 RepID=A0A6M8B2V4_9ACTO|nr:PH domain-containing protein [Actinomyces marmotae]QKD80222.1 PH domain-containing protein [Actinomyces marmotae]